MGICCILGVGWVYFWMFTDFWVDGRMGFCCLFVFGFGVYRGEVGVLSTGECG